MLGVVGTCICGKSHPKQVNVPFQLSFLSAMGIHTL